MFDVTQELTTKTRRKSNTRSMNEDEHKLIQNHQILINRINTPDVQDLLHFIAGLQD